MLAGSGFKTTGGRIGKRMVPEIFGLALLAISGVEVGFFVLSQATAQGVANGIDAVLQGNEGLQQALPPQTAAMPVFRPADRSVSNWRAEAANNLASPDPAVSSLLGDNVSAIPRCVKLNNYWCVKRAGWAGEIAADAEGHVAFASASEGAIVAAMLLRRYYVSYRLRSAHAILSRWAPAQCGPADLVADRAGAARAVPITARLTGLATRGIGNTLRARWLASHRAGFAPRRTSAKPANKRPALYRSSVPTRMVSLMRAPEIAVGMGERALDNAPMKIDLFDLPRPAKKAPGQTCASENQRIRNYALRAIDGLASNPEEDLNLFSPDGSPAANLPLFLRNMAGVEIGPLAVRKDVIEQAVALEAARTAALQAAAAAPR
jgi:hypothetical protein